MTTLADYRSKDLRTSEGNLTDDGVVVERILKGRIDTVSLRDFSSDIGPLDGAVVKTEYTLGERITLESWANANGVAWNTARLRPTYLFGENDYVTTSAFASKVKRTVTLSVGQVHIDTDDGSRCERHDTVSATIPAHDARRLLNHLKQALADIDAMDED